SPTTPASRSSAVSSPAKKSRSRTRRSRRTRTRITISHAVTRSRSHAVTRLSTAQPRDRCDRATRRAERANMSAVFKYHEWTESAPEPPSAEKAGKMLIQLERVKKTYDSGENAVEALKGIDLQIDRGCFVSIIGPSGSGKSTLMHILGCLDTPSSGKYFLDGEDVATLSARALAKIRNLKLGFVFQTFNLLPRATVWKNTELPLLYAGIDSDERKARAMAALERVGLANRAKHRPGELSGGQRQRVAIARALVNNPAVNLDQKTGGDISRLFEELAAGGQTIILVTHDPGIAARTERRIRIVDGLIADNDDMD